MATRSSIYATQPLLQIPQAATRNWSPAMEASPTTSVRAGRYVSQPTGYRAFFPSPLPPEPPIRITGELQTLLSQADLALGRLDGSIQTLPNADQPNWIGPPPAAPFTKPSACRHRLSGSRRTGGTGTVYRCRSGAAAAAVRQVERRAGRKRTTPSPCPPPRWGEGLGCGRGPTGFGRWVDDGKDACEGRPAAGGACSPLPWRERDRERGKGFAARCPPAAKVHWPGG